MNFMALKIGIVGLPNVGKSTLFNALTRSKGAEAANYPFCTIEPNIGVVEVPDKRINKLVKLVNPQKVIPAAIEFVDIAGLVKGASTGEGLGNAFLSHIREVDAICHVVRAFDDGNITHVDGKIDPKRDRETIETELLLADLSSITKRLDKVDGGARSGNKEAQKEYGILEPIKNALESGKPASSVELSNDDDLIARSFNLLTKKPILTAVNVAENQLANADIEAFRNDLDLRNDDQIIVISAKIEEDLCDLSPEEAKEFLYELGVKSSGLHQLIRAAYNALGYLTYFTAGEKEVRAWNIIKGMTAPQAAGVIHTDFEKGFIRAETIGYEDYIATGSEQKAKEAGKMRSEGKEYIVKDGDIMHFRFNV